MESPSSTIVHSPPAWCISACRPDTWVSHGMRHVRLRAAPDRARAVAIAGARRSCRLPSRRGRPGTPRPPVRPPSAPSARSGESECRASGSPARRDGRTSAGSSGVMSAGPYAALARHPRRASAPCSGAAAHFESSPRSSGWTVQGGGVGRRAARRLGEPSAGPSAGPHSAGAVAVAGQLPCRGRCGRARRCRCRCRRSRCRGPRSRRCSRGFRRRPWPAVRSCASTGSCPRSGSAGTRGCSPRWCLPRS